MSLSMILLEMLHCNQISNSTRSTNDAWKESPWSIPQDTSLQKKINTKKKSNGRCVCRVCLKEGTKKIFGNTTGEDLAYSFKIFADIEIRIDDPYPKYLCLSCYRLLQGAILFRKTAQKSFEILKQPSKDLQTADNVGTLNPSLDNNSSEYEPKDENNKKIYPCKKCVMSFDTFKEFDDHQKSKECEKKVVCPVCNKSFTELNFKKHLDLHRAKKPSYVCDICGKNFNFQGHFTQHRLTHFYKLPIKCSLCSYRGRSNQALKLHMRSHTGERPYQCDKCPSRFVTKSNLNRHTLTHNAERDFKCETCGKGFYTKSKLELHYKVDHTGIKEHVCNICEKAFGYRKQMMKHQLRVHKRAKLKSGKMPLYLQVETMKKQGLNVDC